MLELQSQLCFLGVGDSGNTDKVKGLAESLAECRYKVSSRTLRTGEVVTDMVSGHTGHLYVIHHNNENGMGSVEDQVQSNHKYDVQAEGDRDLAQLKRIRNRERRHKSHV